jgi:anti-anti-sigma factor
MSTPNLQHHRDDVRRVRLTGAVDLSATSDLVQAVRRALIEGVGTVEVDVRDVEYLDSPGLAALIRCRRVAQARNADLRVLCAPDSPVGRLLELTGLWGVLDVRDA